LANDNGDEDEVLFLNRKNSPANIDNGNRSFCRTDETTARGDDDTPSKLFDDDTDMSTL
jgi:hypothetical protein